MTTDEVIKKLESLGNFANVRRISSFVITTNQLISTGNIYQRKKSLFVSF